MQTIRREMDEADEGEQLKDKLSPETTTMTRNEQLGKGRGASVVCLPHTPYWLILDHHHPLTMPPIPSTLDEETSNIIASLERRQKDLVDFQLPRLRSCTGPLTLQQQYAAEIRDDLDIFARQLEVCGSH